MLAILELLQPSRETVKGSHKVVFCTGPKKFLKMCRSYQRESSDPAHTSQPIQEKVVSICEQTSLAG